jgi:hypothetical protein
LFIAIAGKNDPFHLRPKTKRIVRSNNIIVQAPRPLEIVGSRKLAKNKENLANRGIFI